MFPLPASPRIIFPPPPEACARTQRSRQHRSTAHLTVYPEIAKVHTLVVSGKIV